MSGFVAGTESSPELSIANSGFWPDIDPLDCRVVMRLEQIVTAERLRAALVNAMISINLDCKLWGATQQAAEYPTLADIPDEDAVDEKNSRVILYNRAVYCFAKAELIERYKDYDSTASGTDKAEEKALTVDDYRRQGSVAIRRFKGESASVIELI